MSVINVIASGNVIVKADEAVLVEGTPNLLFYSKPDPDLFKDHAGEGTIFVGIPSGDFVQASAFVSEEGFEVRLFVQVPGTDQVVVTYAVHRI